MYIYTPFKPTLTSSKKCVIVLPTKNTQQLPRTHLSPQQKKKRGGGSLDPINIKEHWRTNPNKLHGCRAEELLKS